MQRDIVAGGDGGGCREEIERVQREKEGRKKRGRRERGEEEEESPGL